jgi:predicted permease
VGTCVESVNKEVAMRQRTWLDGWRRDLKYALRSLARDRAFTVVALLTLTVGIGATTAIFTVVNSVLLRPLPYAHPEQLFSVQEAGAGFGKPTSYPDFEDWRSQNRVFSEMSCYHGADFTVTGASGAAHVDGLVVSANLFRMLGVSPALGPGFAPGDDSKGTRVAAISDKLWREQFHADPAIAGHAIRIDGVEFTVAGIMAPGFHFPPASEVDLWTTTAVDFGPPRTQRGYSWLSTIARLRPGASAAQAQAEMNVIARRLAAQYPENNKHRNYARTVPELERIVGNSQRSLILLFGVAAGVLLIACVNLANISLARNLARAREIAIRAALGAGRAALIAQLLTEGVVVSLAGGLLGVVAAHWGTQALLAAIPAAVPRAKEIAVDGEVLLFAVILSVVTGILSGIVPAWQVSMPNVDEALKQSRQSASETGARRRLRDLLVAAETALAVVLLTGAGLLIASYLRLMHVDPGFDPRNLLTFDFTLPFPEYNSARTLRFYDDVMARLRSSPQVKSAVASWPVPFTFAPSSAVDIEGRAYPKGEQPSGGVHLVSPGYFHAMGMQLRGGRDFTEHDILSSPQVVIVDEAFAREFFPNQNPVGKRIRPSLAMSEPIPWREIVAVVNNTKGEGLAEPFRPQYYIPYAQLPGPQPQVVVRTEADPAQFARTIRRVVAEIDSGIPVYGFKNMNQLIAESTARSRLNTLLFGLFGAFAVVLAAVGIYGVASYSVNRARHEFGIRMALGAQARDVLKLTLWRTLRWVAGGFAVGLLLTVWLTKLIESLLFGVKPTDPIAIGAACVVLLAVAVVASYIPARRATKVDPLVALRWD